MECKTGNCLQYQSSIWSMNYQWKYSSTLGQKFCIGDDSLKDSKDCQYHSATDTVGAIIEVDIQKNF